MAKEPGWEGTPPRPKRPLGNEGRDRVTHTYTAVYAAAARFGMNTEVCRRYARDAVADLTDLVREIDKELLDG